MEGIKHIFVALGGKSKVHIFLIENISKKGHYVHVPVRPPLKLNPKLQLRLCHEN